MSRSNRLYSATESGEVSTRPQLTSLYDEETSVESEEIDQEVEYLSLLSGSSTFGIPECDFDELRILHKEGHGTEVLELGGGLTSRVIQHVTGSSLSNILPSATIVAVKIFSLKIESKGERSLVLARSGPILQEIKTLSHPALSHHPNIAKLCFIGWERERPLPMLATEIGPHGTLDYIIKRGGDSLPTRIKKHITIDIISGLYAVYEAGFLYGDLKPENIIIAANENPHRQVVAKLIDFGGATDAAHIGAKPLYFTPLWCAPEILCRASEIDWERADVYSFGLVVASMWARMEGQSAWASSNFLLATAPPEVTEDTASYLKRMKDEDRVIYSLAKLLRTSPIGPSEYSNFLEAFRPALRASALTRPSMRELYANITSLGEALGRRKWEKNSGSMLRHSKNNLEYSLNPNHLCYNRWHHRLRWTESLADRTRMGKQGDIPSNLPDGMTANEFLDHLMSSIKQLIPMETTLKSLSLVSQSAFVVGIEHFGFGRSPGKAVEYLRLSAVHGLKRAISIVTPMIVGSSLAIEFPIRLFLSSLALSGSTWAIELLSLHWPSHFRMVRSILRERRLPYMDVASQFPFHEDPFSGLTVHSFREHQPTQSKVLTLHEAVCLGMVDELEQILEGKIEAADFDETIPAFLHHLSYLTDQEAAGLARLAYIRGAKLDLMTAAASPILDDNQFKIPTSNDFNDLRELAPELLSPLSSAIRRGRRALSLELICLHLEFDIPIPDFQTALTLSFVYLYFEVGQILYGLYNDNPALCQVFQGKCTTTMDFTPLLKTAIHPGLNVIIERNFLHGNCHDLAYNETLSCLLSFGANPIHGAASLGRGANSLFRAIERDDAIGLALIVEHLDDSGTSFLSAMLDYNYEGIHRDPWIPEMCIAMNCGACFKFLIEKYGASIFEHRGKNNKTLLHDACSIPEGTEFAHLLIRSGSNVMVKNNQGHSPLALALQQHHLETADLIADMCSQKQLEELLSRDNFCGQSIFSDLVADWIRNRRPRHVQSLEWLRRHGGEHFYGAQDIPVWFAMFGLPRPLSFSDQMWDRALLSFLLESPVFSSRVNTDFFDGRTLLHYMAAHGHIESVKLLRDENFDMAISAKPDGTDESFKLMFLIMPKVTALDLVADQIESYNSKPPPENLSFLPDSVSQSGPIQLEKWLQDLESIQKLLTGCGCEQTEMIPEMVSPEDLDAAMALLQPYGDDFLPGTAAKGLGGGIAWPVPISKAQSDQSKTTLRLPRIKGVGLEEERDRMKQDDRIWEFEENLASGWRWIAIGQLGPTFGAAPTPLFEHIETGLLSIKKPGTFIPYRHVDGNYKKQEEDDLYSATPKLRAKAAPEDPESNLTLDSSPIELSNGVMDSEQILRPGDTSSTNAETRHHPQKTAHNDFRSITWPDMPDPRSADFNGHTVLHIATSANYIRGLEKLLLRKEYLEIIEYRSHLGWTPLEVAVHLGHSGAAALLLRYGAAPKGTDPETDEPLLHYCIRKMDVETTRVLIKAGADTNEQDSKGVCPLFACFHTGQHNMFQILSENGVDLNKELNGLTVMDCAYCAGDTECLRQVLRVGANPDARCTRRYRTTLLHVAVREGNIEMAKILVEYGANVNVEDGEGLIPVVAAIIGEHEEIIELLLTHGADVFRISPYQFFRRKDTDDVFVFHSNGPNRKRVTVKELTIHASEEEEAEDFESDDEDSEWEDEDSLWEEWEPVQMMVGVVDEE